MKQFLIGTIERYSVNYSVEAETKEEAIKKWWNWYIFGNEEKGVQLETEESEGIEEGTAVVLIDPEEKGYDEYEVSDIEDLCEEGIL